MKVQKIELVVLGAGPGGYAAAFYAADRGKKVILVDRGERLGGVCLNSGCIPSKAYLHVTKLIREALMSKERGIYFGAPRIDLKELRQWKDSIVGKLAQGIEDLAEKRGVEVIQGRGFFEGSHNLRVETSKGQQTVEYEHAVIAVGSRPALPKSFDLGNKRIMTSTEALDMEEIPDDLLVVGGGYIGMELGTVYSVLGSRVVLAEALDTILSGLDKDLVRPVKRYAKENFKEVRLNAKVGKMATAGSKIKVDMEANGKKTTEFYDKVLVSVGRVPNTGDLGLENTQVGIDSSGCVEVNPGRQTRDPAIFAIGDVVGGVLLAHKASREAKIAIDSILGQDASFDNIVMPVVIFTDPEIAWCGLTETEAHQQNIPIQIAKFPWSASGRALSQDRTDGTTKLILDPETERILGVGLVGAGAGELIGEGVLAVEMAATARDLADSIHPHPTLSETLMEAAEVFYGTSTHVMTRRAKAKSSEKS